MTHPRHQWIRTIAVLGIAVIAAIAMRSTITRHWQQWASHRRDVALARAVNALPYRPLEARLSGAYAYRPLQTQSRGESRDKRPPSLMAAAATIESAVAETPASDLGAARILIGDLDGAIDAWTRVLREGRRGATLDTIVEHATDAAVLSDLACAYYERSRTRNRPIDLMVAAAIADRAYRLMPSIASHAWNRALTIEALGVRTEAARAWRDYLAVDSASDWAVEAKQRLLALEVEPDSVKWEKTAVTLKQNDSASLKLAAEQSPVRIRAMVDHEWIPQWGEEARRHGPEAPKLFAAIEQVGTALQTKAGDTFLSDFVNRARTAVNVDEFAAAHAQIVTIGPVLQSEGTTPAVKAMENVARELDRVGSPFALALRVEKAGLLYHAGQFTEALATLDALQSTLDSQQWPLLAARAAWNRGVSLASLGYVRGAAASYGRALELYGRTGDKTQSGMLQTLLADNAEMAGRSDETWHRYVAGMRDVERHGEPSRAIVILDGFTRAALRAGHPLFARLLNQMLIGRSQAPEDAPYLCHALITSCDVHVRLGDHTTAATQCAAARQIWSGIVDSAVRDRLAADLSIATAAASDRASRIALLSEAVDVSSERRDLFRLSRVLLLRGRAYVDAGSVGLAKADFARGLDVIEEQRQRLDLVADRLTYFEIARETAEELVRLLVRTGEASNALSVVERVRARVLVEQLAQRRAPDWSESQLRRRLGAGQAVVEYWADPTALYVWVLRRDTRAFKIVDVSRDELTEMARRFRSTLESETEVAFGDLYGILLRPIIPALTAADSVTVVPDEAIAGIPFSAIRDDAGVHLVAKYAFAESPSASALAFLPVAAVPRSTLLLVNPATALELPSLDVRAETRSALRALPHNSLHEGHDAKASVLQSLARDYELVHIAAHTVEEDGDPALALAPEAGRENGVLRVGEIEKLELRPGAVIVLAGCGTGRGRNLSEGTLSIARAFLAAGAAAVIATYWDATDEDTARLLPTFYAQLAAGKSPVHALRSAQIAMGENPTVKPGQWAVYHLLGGM